MCKCVVRKNICEKIVFASVETRIRCRVTRSCCAFRTSLRKSHSLWICDAFSVIHGNIGTKEIFIYGSLNSKSMKAYYYVSIIFITFYKWNHSSKEVAKYIHEYISFIHNYWLVLKCFLIEHSSNSNNWHNKLMCIFSFQRYSFWYFRSLWRSPLSSFILSLIRSSTAPSKIRCISAKVDSCSPRGGNLQHITFTEIEQYLPHIHRNHIHSLA